MRKGGCHPFLFCEDLWLRRGIILAKSTGVQCRGADHSRKSAGLCSQPESSQGQSVRTRRGTLAPRCTSRGRVSIRAGENKVLAYMFVRHLEHIEVRGGNNRTQNSIALHDEIMALCMVTDTEVSFHRPVKVHLGDLLFPSLLFLLILMFSTHCHIFYFSVGCFFLISSHLTPTQPCCSVVAVSVPTAQEWFPSSASQGTTPRDTSAASAGLSHRIQRSGPEGLRSIDWQPQNGPRDIKCSTENRVNNVAITMHISENMGGTPGKVYDCLTSMLYT